MAEILIKNMEIPKGDIPLVIIINSDGSVEEIDGSDEINATDAKAIEIPPHGPLKDIRAIIDSAPHECESCDRAEKCEGCDYQKWVKRLAEAPTVLEASKERE